MSELKGDITEILDDEYGESAPCIVNLIIQRVVEDIKGMENPYPKWTSTFQRSTGIPNADWTFFEMVKQAIILRLGGL